MERTGPRGRAGEPRPPSPRRPRARCDRSDPELESTLRAAQEALANVASHARATAAELRLRRSATEVELSVSDDGTGFDPRAGTGELGLTVLGERLALVDGALSIDSSPGAGTKLSARVPV